MSEEQKNSPPASSEVRKLAAIMFTDIKDFSKKMQKDEAATMRMLKTHNQMMTDAVSKNSGTVIKTIGDAFLVSFDSVINATLCAIEVQQNFHEYNSQVQSDDEKITVRIGVHLGDVIVKDKDVFGDGVNIASRIQSIAEVGGVNISESVYQQVRNKINIKVLNLGVPQLKGIDQPIRIYQVIIVPTDKARGALATNIYVLKTILKRKKTKRLLTISSGAIAVGVVAWMYLLAPVAPQNSLAVLPFKNLGDSSNVYIADGFTEEITSDLTKLPDVRVLSEGSTRALKNTDLSEKEIAKKLGVRFLLVGSLEVRPTEIAAHIRLAEPENDVDKVNVSFTKPREELFSIEQEVFRQVYSKFTSELLSTGAAKTSAEVYNLYYQGLAYDLKERKEDNLLAIKFFEQVTEKDPYYAQGYIKLASSQLLNLEKKYDLSEHWLKDAEENIRKAYAMDTNDAQVYWLFGRLSILKGNRKEGFAFLEKSIKKNPNFMRSYQILGREYGFIDPAKAIPYLTKASELEPTNYNTAVNLGVSYAQLKNYSEAISTLRHAATLNPSQELPWINLGYLYERTSQLDSAEAAYRSAFQRNPGNPTTGEYLATLLLSTNRLAQAESTLNVSLQYEPSNYHLIYVQGVAKSLKGQNDAANKIWQDGAKLAEEASAKNPNVAEHYLYVGFFAARLGIADSAIEHGKRAVTIDSSDESNIIGLAKIYAVLGKKQEMIEWFKRARTMNMEYDQSYLSQDIDFEKFRKDDDLLLVARQ